MIYIGIDPGVNGAVVSFDGDSYECFKCPDTVSGMAETLIEIKAKGACRAVIEKVNAMPGQGVTSMFNFGKNFGQWQGILAALGIPCIEVPPQKWQKIIGCMPKEKKERKHFIQDFVQKKLGHSVTLYASDAYAIAIISNKLWV